MTPFLFDTVNGTLPLTNLWHGIKELGTHDARWWKGLKKCTSRFTCFSSHHTTSRANLWRAESVHKDICWCKALAGVHTQWQSTGSDPAGLGVPKAQWQRNAALQLSTFEHLKTTALLRFHLMCSDMDLKLSEYCLALQLCDYNPFTFTWRKEKKRITLNVNAELKYLYISISVRIFI